MLIVLFYRCYNSFFSNFDTENRCSSRLKLSKILEIVYYWCCGENVSKTIKLTGCSKPTIVNWFQYCRKIIIDEWSTRSKIGGENRVIQVDECLLCGRRKNNVGRLRLGDMNCSQQIGRNYGSRIDGPWVLGLVEKLSDGNLDA